MAQPRVDAEAAVAELVREVAVTGLASVIAGLLVGGVGGRVVMRISALAAGPEAQGSFTEGGNRVGEITFGGTVELVIFGGILTGAIAAVVVVIGEPWLRWMGALRWIGFGLVALAVGGESVIDASNRDFFFLRPAELNVAMFVGLFFAFGLVLQLARAVLDSRLPPATRQPQPGYLVVAAVGVPFLFLLFAAFTIPSFCECEDPLVEIALLLAAMGLATLGSWAKSAAPNVPRWVGVVASLMGYGSLALLLAFGLQLVTEQIRLIL